MVPDQDDLNRFGCHQRDQCLGLTAHATLVNNTLDYVGLGETIAAGRVTRAQYHVVPVQLLHLRK